MMKRDSWQEILALVLLGGMAFLFISLFTYHQEDYLLGDRILNACGEVGAVLSYHLIVWLGKWGAYTLTAALAWWGFLLLAQQEVQGLGWKAVGLVIFLLTLASLEVAFTGGGSSNQALPGGYYGQFFYDLLVGRLNRTGSFLILFVATAVSFLISTEQKFYPALARAGRAALDQRKRRLAVQVLAGGLAPFRLLKSLSLPALRSPLRFTFRGWPRREWPSEPQPPRPETASTLTGESGDEGGEAAAPEGREPAAGEPERIDDHPPLELKVNIAPPAETARSLAASGGARRPVKKGGKYQMPPLDLLQPVNHALDPLDRNIIQETAAKIEETLRHFKIEAQVVEVQKGPVITQYEVSLAAGIKVHKIVSLADDLAMALKARSIRIVAPIPGKSTVGVEVPNRHRATVVLRELLEGKEFNQSTQRVPLAIGKDIAGAPIIWDLGEMPHLLIAGSTGSGKSVCINSIIINLLMNKSPDEVKLILIDPKMVELSAFEQIPHLLTPVVTDMRKAPAVLNWLVDKMDERYELLALAGVRHLSAYNALGRKELRERMAGKLEEARDETPDFLPHIVVIIDELADLMMSASKEVEASITRLSQKSRAVGIHVILATQRPSVDVITGLIKANMPCRISFQVTSKVDSRTILDRNGADKLLGKGDMLFLPPGTSNLIRAQGTFISDKEIHNVVEFVRQEAEPLFDGELARFGIDGAGDGGEEDELYEQAVRIILESQRGSATLLQRQLQIGYTRASRLLELMESNGLVGPFKGSKAREVYYTIDEWEAARNQSSSKPKGDEGEE
ncbi:MAG: DNA translocase FtsK 4TM domain-containing protein [Planctomycetes bacterium]|nr:DNA translocase FtsK 4TM domain-containing protein [Planctomycetota bacterium]